MVNNSFANLYPFCLNSSIDSIAILKGGNTFYLHVPRTSGGPQTVAGL